MNSLKVPDSGLLLAGSGSETGLPPQAFHIQLDKSTIDAIIQSSRNGEELRLALGQSPTLQFGSKSHRISPPDDSADYDLYLTRPFESTRRAERIPSTTSVFEKPAQAGKSSASDKASRKGSTSGLDSDIEALQNGLAAHDAARERARVVGNLPDAKASSAKPKAKLISNYGSKSGSLPTSPSLHGVTSPSLNPTLTASQQAMERAKEQRVTLVHELAVKDRSTGYLKSRWEGKEHEFQMTLEKVAEHSADSDTWTMRKTYWKELDVWSYDYASQEERQVVIDNAIRQFDKQRLSAYEAVWQKLLPKEERGKGKCLSRLQANLAKGPPPPAPKIKVQKAEDGSTSGDGLESDKAKAGGEKMSRSTSNPLPKAKKLSGPEAQAKRLLGPSKTGASKAKAKPSTQKTSPAKSKGAGSKANGGRILSQEIIVNSDTSGDEAPAPPPVFKPKPKPKPAAPKVKDTVVVAGRPPAKAPTRTAPAKRPREDDDSSSSSGTPLSKRIKQRQPLPAARLKHRPSDASVNSRGTAASSSFKSKNTSPTKSSPLASSPPTNASDLENDALPRPKMKRKAEMESKPLAAKRRAAESVSLEILRKANKFKAYYQQYEALHHEISALDNPPHEKLADLLDMRGRLESMKKEIYRECSPARD
ncbi:com1 regulatory [Trichoderma cornu-damae]|uniref:Com1 regulatory n=1 Tax=Trichoderma cornu-damae TaxID=654480 RepID=A0A9P8QN29_9HYPO|nr:com1 regulatory [Trichoderma cornu-damae]